MASVTSNNARKYRYLGQETEDETQPSKVVTLRDKIFKQFLEKQLNVSSSIEEQVKKKEFVKAATEESITTTTSGLLSNTEFRNRETEYNVHEILSASGLSNSEIKILLDEDSGNSSHEDPYARELKLREISNKLSKRQELLDRSTNEPEHFSSAIPLNRHDFEEECNSIPITDGADKLTACLVRLEPHHNVSIPAGHPLNHIKELAEEIFPSDNTSKANIEQKKRKVSEDTPTSEERKKKTDQKFKYFTQKPKSFWDMQEVPKVVRTNESCNTHMLNSNDSTKIVQRSSNNKCSIDKTKCFIFPLQPTDLVPLKEICSNRKSIQEIKSMEKFLNYNAGEPSKTLYIKNLSHKITPRDLAAILGHFESPDGPKIMYRILGGRMRGQAFVTFQDVSLATMALKTCNGYILNDKPMVIAYGKK